MAQTTFTNGCGVSDKGSGGKSIVFPDVCKIPVGPAIVPNPYPSLGQFSDTTKSPTSVKADGQMRMVKGAQYSASAGNEAGVAKGIASSATSDVYEFLMYSANIKGE